MGQQFMPQPPQQNMMLQRPLDNSTGGGSQGLTQFGGSSPANIGQQRPIVSDENLKQNVEPATRDLTNFMNSIGAYNYRYKSPEQDGAGTFTSPMAQDLQKTELGKQAVIETPRGLMVDYARLGGVNLAAVSVVHREQAKLAAQVQRLREAVRKRG